VLARQGLSDKPDSSMKTITRPCRAAIFLVLGHLLAFHVRTARSSRSRAWPVGRCTLQPSRPSNRQTEVETSFTENFVSISCAIRGAVHNSVEKPAASAPSFEQPHQTPAVVPG